MPDLLIRTPTKGLSSRVPETAKDLYTAAEGTQNILYQNGTILTPDGFAKLGLTTSGLNSGDTVLAVFQWREIDRTTHLMAATTGKLYDRDVVNDTWNDKTQSGKTMDSNIDNPISYVEVGHDDTNIYIDDDATKANAYHHVIVCDGGLTDIQRWAGRFETDFADLTGGGDYHDGTTHRAKQVSLSSKNRLLLLSPLEYSSSSKIWVEKNQRIRWPTIGKIQTYTGTGSGFADLFDTGGVNVWALPLGMDHIIYQTKGIWSINYVGGTAIYDPRPMIPDLGLLAPHALISYNNVHYFMGTDYNVHAYYGGYAQDIISEEVHKLLFDDLYEQYESRCWMSMSPRGEFLWILIASSGGYLTKAYIRNMKEGSWAVRDFEGGYSSGGLTSITLAGSTSYIVGDTYNEELDRVSLYDDSVGDATMRYGDYLVDTSRTLAADYTAGTWSAGGFDYSKNGENFNDDFTDNDVILLEDPSGTNTIDGYHFFTAYDVSTNGFSLHGTKQSSGDPSHGIADSDVNVPADLSFAGNGTFIVYSVCTDDDPGETYNEALETVRVAERIILGDNSGYVYQIDETYTTDDGIAIDCRHVTPVIDAGAPHRLKRWGSIHVTAKGSRMNVSYRTDSFDTSDTGWTDYTTSLTDEYQTYNYYPNVSSKKIQVMMSVCIAGWFGVSSGHLESHCGNSGATGWTLQDALAGSGEWLHDTDETHSFILDLEADYRITGVRSRSNSARDPVDVDIYAATNTTDWSTAIASGIATWKDTTSWTEITTTSKVGRYVKVSVRDTEDAFNRIAWGGAGNYTIFDIYVEPARALNISNMVVGPPQFQGNR